VRQAASAAIYLLSSLLGALAFLYPFLDPAHAVQAPILTAGIAGLALLALLLEAQGRVLAARTIATLGVLVAIVSVLRFVEVAIPGPGGFTPMFTPLILGGYVFGARFGFLLGAFSLLVSALITGGVGPWLPYQMFAAGWMGLSAGGLGRLLGPVALRHRRFELAALCAFGFGWGLLYGAIMNLYSWPFAAGPPELYWAPGVGPADALSRYAAFYLATSLWWDVAGALGNVLLMLALAPALTRAFARFRRRLRVELGSAT
jgi:energy-coupling factor transport system substrate-specific component